VASRGLFPPGLLVPDGLEGRAPSAAQREYEGRVHDFKNFLDFSDSAVPPLVAKKAAAWGGIHPGPDEIVDPNLPVGRRVEFDFTTRAGAVERTRGVIVYNAQTYITILATDEHNQFAAFLYPRA
jgi:hypothetical protein